MCKQEMKERFGVEWHGAGGNRQKRLYQASRGNISCKDLERKVSVDITFQEVRTVQCIEAVDFSQRNGEI